MKNRPFTVSPKIHKPYTIAILASALLALTFGGADAQTVQGSISGIVYGPDGKPLGGTTVWANLVSPVPRPVDRNSAVPSLVNVSAGGGSFTLSQVPQGDYVLCASNASVPTLNPCAWGGAPAVKIANGINVTGASIRMALGGTLQLHLDDPGGLLAREGKVPGASLIVGLATPHGFLPLPISGHSATGRDYKMLVPFDVTHSVLISTRYFKLTDANAAAVGAAPIPVSIPTGTQGKQINLRVAGVGGN